MASTMLLLLAASGLPALKKRLDTRVLTAGRHLRHLIKAWMYVPANQDHQVSPSVSQSLRMINEIDTLLQWRYSREEED